MNSDFQKRQMEVLEILSLLSREAIAAGETLVFIGGSAVQTAALKKLMRLSIDLDIYYSGDAEALVSKLVGYSYAVEKRPVKQADLFLFLFYNVFKGNVQVKVDITRFPLINKGKPFEPKKLAVGKKFFEVNVATPNYLLASKLAALAIGTVGRSAEKEGFGLAFLKDVFDSNCLVEGFGVGSNVWNYFEQICQVQNKVRGTSFNFMQVIESAINALLDSVAASSKVTYIRKSHLSEFQNAYLEVGTISAPAYWTMTCRLAAYLNMVKVNGVEGANEAIGKMEKIIAEKYGDTFFVNACEAELINRGFEPKKLHEFKITSPRALLYLFVAQNGKL